MCSERSKPPLFYQRRIARHLAKLGFRVICVERQPLHPVWELRLQGTLDALATLMMSCPCARPSVKEPFERQLKVQVCEVLGKLGKPLKVADMTVIRSGSYYRVLFVWPRGRTGKYNPKVYPAPPLTAPRGTRVRRRKR